MIVDPNKVVHKHMYNSSLKDPHFICDPIKKIYQRTAYCGLKDYNTDNMKLSWKEVTCEKCLEFKGKKK